MWTMTANGGFLSAVQHDEDPDLLVVRSRVKADALTLAQYLVLYRHLASEPRDMLITYATSDYPWRVIVPRDVFASFLAAQVAAIDYGNFKAAVGLISPEHAHAYARVWADLLVLERTDPASSLLLRHLHMPKERISIITGDDRVPVRLVAAVLTIARCTCTFTFRSAFTNLVAVRKSG